VGTVTVELKDLNVHYESRNQKTQIFSDLRLQVLDNEILTIVGASGTGKTTLLNIIAGFLTPNKGVVDFQTPKPKIGFAFQKPALFPWLSVRANIEFGLRLAAQGKLTQVERHSTVSKLLDVLGLNGIQNNPVNSLSGGQAQRVAIARTLAINPKLLLLDEPFGALDAGTRQQLQEWLKSLKEKLNLTIVLVTHDLEEAIFLGDRVAFLNHETKKVQIFETPNISRLDVTESDTYKQILNQLRKSKEQTWQI
jgi:NitT/TauT family transport system ATP-binding protein